MYKWTARGDKKIKATGSGGKYDRICLYIPAGKYTKNEKYKII